jgi:hypothetical protein
MRAVDAFSSSLSHSYGNSQITPFAVSVQTCSWYDDPSALLQLAVFSTRVCSTMGGDTNETGYAYLFLLRVW